MEGKTNKFAIIIMIIISIIVSAMVVFFIKYQTVDNYMTARCYNYLSEKYGADKSEFTLLDHDKKHLYFNDAAIPELEWAPYKWEFEYNGRSFFVNRIDGKYYDDYQLEDIECWCTEWLQQNVDERIFGCYFETEDLIGYGKICHKANIEAMIKGDIPVFINDYLLNSSYNNGRFVFYYDKSITKDNYSEIQDDVSDEIEEKFQNALDYGEKAYVVYSDGKIIIDECQMQSVWETTINVEYKGTQTGDGSLSGIIYN